MTRPKKKNNKGGGGTATPGTAGGEQPGKEVEALMVTNSPKSETKKEQTESAGRGREKGGGKGGNDPQNSNTNESESGNKPQDAGRGRGRGKGSEQPKSKGPQASEGGGSVLGGPQKEPKKASKGKPRVNFQEEAKQSNSDSEELELVTPGASDSNKKFEFKFDSAVQKPSHDPDNPFAEDSKDDMENNLEKLPQSVQTRIKALRKLHANYIDLKKEFQKELFALEKKYEGLYQPSFTKRSEIITGQYEPTVNDVPEEEKASFSINAEDEKGIPEFWLQALQNNDLIGDTITQRDSEALKFLVDIRCVSHDQEFELHFEFAENPYFTDRVLVKKYYRQIDDDGEETYTKSEGCTIHWKPGKNLTVEKVKQKRKKKGAKKAAFVIKETPCDSFFLFFSPPVISEDEEDHEVIDLSERDFDIGSTIKDSVVPVALMWFTGEIDQSDYPGMNDLFDQDDNESEDLDDDESDSDEISSAPRSRFSSKKSGHHAHPHSHGAKSAPPSQAEPSNQGSTAASGSFPGVEQPPNCSQQ